MTDSEPGAPAPLAGRTVVVTRPQAQAADLVAPLEDLGARVVLFPTIEIVPPEDPEPLRRAAREAAGYDWLVFTSVNGVEWFGRALEEENLDPAGWPAGVEGSGSIDGSGDPGSEHRSPGPRVCAIGPATGEALEAIGLTPHVIPEEYVAEAVVEALDREARLDGARILLPRAAVARSALPRGLKTRGATVDVVEAYRTVPATGDAPELRALLDAGEVDLVTFTASSTVRYFHLALGGNGEGEHDSREAVAGEIPVAAIGPITADTARSLGYRVVAVAEEYTIPGLVRTVAAHLGVGRSS